MSLGSTNKSLHESSIAIAFYAAITKGIFPCATAANEGPFKSLIANDEKWILTVGESTTDRRIRAIVKLGNGMEFYGESTYQPGPSNSTQLPLVYPGALGTTDTLLCLNDSLDTFNVSGKIVLCAKGNIDDVEKGKIVKATGGAGMILVNLGQEGERETERDEDRERQREMEGECWDRGRRWKGGGERCESVLFSFGPRHHR